MVRRLSIGKNNHLTLQSCDQSSISQQKHKLTVLIRFPSLRYCNEISQRNSNVVSQEILMRLQKEPNEISSQKKSQLDFTRNLSMSKSTKRLYHISKFWNQRTDSTGGQLSLSVGRENGPELGFKTISFNP